MTMNDVLQAAAGKLKGLWPDRKVHCNEIPRDADGTFHISFTDSEQRQELDRRYRRTVGVQILFFLASRETMEYLDWAEQMYDNFRYLTVGDRLLRLQNCSAQKDSESRFFQFLFDIDMNFVEAAPVSEPMENLQLQEDLKS